MQRRVTDSLVSVRLDHLQWMFDPRTAEGVAAPVGLFCAVELSRAKDLRLLKLPWLLPTAVEEHEAAEARRKPIVPANMKGLYEEEICPAPPVGYELVIEPGPVEHRCPSGSYRLKRRVTAGGEIVLVRWLAIIGFEAGIADHLSYRRFIHDVPMSDAESIVLRA